LQKTTHYITFLVSLKGYYYKKLPLQLYANLLKGPKKENSFIISYFYLIYSTEMKFNLIEIEIGIKSQAYESYQIVKFVSIL